MTGGALERIDFGLSLSLAFFLAQRNLSAQEEGPPASHTRAPHISKMTFGWDDRVQGMTDPQRLMTRGELSRTQLVLPDHNYRPARLLP